MRGALQDAWATPEEREVRCAEIAAMIDQAVEEVAGVVIADPYVLTRAAV